MKRNKLTKTSHESGSAILEFALAIPLLILSISGMIYTAESFGEMISLSQVAYNTALSGSEQAPAAAAAAMDKRRDFMTNNENKLRGKFLAAAATQVTSGAYDDVRKLVTANLSVKTMDIFNMEGWELKVVQSIVSPVLYNAPTGTSQEYNSFANPPENKYDCSGNRVGDYPENCLVAGNGQQPVGGQGAGLEVVIGLPPPSDGSEPPAEGESHEGCYQLTEDAEWTCPAL